MSKNNNRKKPYNLVESAKSGRSRCRSCNELIEKNELRIGMVTFRPHRNTRFYHLSHSCMSVSSLNIENINEGQKSLVNEYLQSYKASLLTPTEVATGELGFSQLAGILTRQYNKFRGFSFGLSTKFTENWNWRCFIATILVCNTKETSMLRVTQKLFIDYPDPESLLQLRTMPSKREELLTMMDQMKLRHGGKKLGYILGASEAVRSNKGLVPNTRKDLMAIKGVGRHVSSVTMAWVHQKGEFGIDVHVKRILSRLGLITGKERELEIEKMVKKQVDKKKIGHFSRSFVDFGQNVCGYIPNCESCPLNKVCPTGQSYLSRELDW